MSDRIFEATLTEPDKARMESCFERLSELYEEYGDTLNDCMLYLCGSIEMEREDEAREEMLDILFACEDGAGNA